MDDGLGAAPHESAIWVAETELDAVGAEVDLAQGQATSAASLDQKIEASKRLGHATEDLRDRLMSVDAARAGDFGHRLGLAEIQQRRLNEDILTEIDGRLSSAHMRGQTGASDKQSMIDVYGQVLDYYLAVSESGMVPNEEMPAVAMRMQEAIGRIDTLRSEVGTGGQSVAESYSSAAAPPVSATQGKVRPVVLRLLALSARPWIC